ncbi:MAG: hypothetical protein ACFCU3_09340 [Verrucomicrobiales bacterium]
MQHGALQALPTQLVCPLRRDVALTPLREKIRWHGGEYVAVCDLIRPIRTTALKQVGELDEVSSGNVIRTFLRMLPEA